MIRRKDGLPQVFTEETRAAMAERARALAAARDARRAEDPEFDQAFRAARRRGALTTNSSPEHASRMKEVRQANAAALGKVMSARRRRCLECGLVTNPGGMGQHLKHKRHSGYEDLG